MSRRLIDAAHQLRRRANDAIAGAITTDDTDSAELVRDLAQLVVRLAEEADQAEARADAAGLGQ
jgi:hypothetical protein